MTLTPRSRRIKGGKSIIYIKTLRERERRGIILGNNGWGRDIYIGREP